MRKNIQDTCSKNKENAQNNLNDRIYFARIEVQIILQIAIKKNSLKNKLKHVMLNDVSYIIL